MHRKCLALMALLGLLFAPQACLVFRGYETDTVMPAAYAPHRAPAPPSEPANGNTVFKARFTGLEVSPRVPGEPTVVVVSQSPVRVSMLSFSPSPNAWLEHAVRTGFGSGGVALVDEQNCDVPRLSVTVEEFFAEAVGANGALASGLASDGPHTYFGPTLYVHSYGMEAVTVLDVRLTLPQSGQTWHRRFVGHDAVPLGSLPTHDDEIESLRASVEDALANAVTETRSFLQDSNSVWILEGALPEVPLPPQPSPWRTAAFVVPALEWRSLDVNAGDAAAASYNFHPAFTVPVTLQAEWNSIYVGATAGGDVGNIDGGPRSEVFGASAGWRKAGVFGASLDLQRTLWRGTFSDRNGTMPASVPWNEIRLTGTFPEWLQWGVHMAWASHKQALYRYDSFNGGADYVLSGDAVVNADTVYTDIFFNITTVDPIKAGLQEFHGVDAAFGGGMGLMYATWPSVTLGTAGAFDPIGPSPQAGLRSYTGTNQIAGDVRAHLGYQVHHAIDANASFHLKAGYQVHAFGGGNLPPDQGNNDGGDADQLIAYNVFLHHGPYLYAAIVY